MRQEKLIRASRRYRRARWFRARRARSLVARAAVVAGATAEDIAGWAEKQDRVDQLEAEVDLPADPDADRKELAAADAALAKAGAAALRHAVHESLHEGRAALQQLARARPARIADSSPAALRYALGWGCTALSVRATFPLSAGLFDLLVVDEASQCSIAAIVPLAYRARRILVVGDPNQLTPVVTLDDSSLQQIAKEAGTTHRALRDAAVSVGDDSAFTAYNRRADKEHLLEEHYRCDPRIAQFINDHFYAGRLRVLTRVAAHQELRGPSFINVPGRTRRGQLGGAYNDEEAEAIVGWVLDHQHDTGSIGVVTPFKSQVRSIEDRLRAKLHANADRVRVGTAHTFQGDERDIILFSLVIGANHLPGTARWVEQQRNLINVAVSRAIRALIVFGDQRELARAKVPTLHALIDFASASLSDNAGDVAGWAASLTEVSALHSEPERRLYAALEQAGFDVQLKPRVEGYELDFAIHTPDGPVNIEVDGTQHTDSRGRQRRQDLVRDAILADLGWRVIRKPAWCCLKHPEKEAADIAASLSTRVPVKERGTK